MEGRRARSACGRDGRGFDLGGADGMTDRGARKHEQRKKRTRERSHARSGDGGVRWRRRRTAPYLVWPDENRLRPRIRRGRASPFSAPFLPRTRVAFFFFFFCRLFSVCFSFFFFFPDSAARARGERPQGRVALPDLGAVASAIFPSFFFLFFSLFF
ncbi:hypothetical protein [Pandoravirus japonicus]|uniref:Transmembrane protein n=1 Tax=Pandoravirus japonicus TaxID=2823154 RepID=A0A811BPR0_9VIRU|nr:hypothetical protein [Pandoravirus japonicus]